MKIKEIFRFSTLLLLLSFASCSRMPQEISMDGAQAYLVDYPEEGCLLANYAPIYLIENDCREYNKIGTPSLELSVNPQKGCYRAFVDPCEATVYGQIVNFETCKGNYTNLIYRTHFQKVPFRLFPFNIITGKNVGLLTIITLNDRKEPILITTAHTCGCFKAIIPTNFLSKDAYPCNWYTGKQLVCCGAAKQWLYGEVLPAGVDYPGEFSTNIRPVLLLRDQTHRVTNVVLMDINEVKSEFDYTDLSLAPIETLKRLPLNGEELSFYGENYIERGLVRNCYKPFELLFMSWFSLDPTIGVDKEYTCSSELRTPFYTSLKPWARKDSDLWEFNNFLTYWGWNL